MNNEPEQPSEPELSPANAGTRPDLSSDASDEPLLESSPFQPYSFSGGDEAPLFLEVAQSPAPPPQRIPNFGHLSILVLIALCGIFCAAMLAQVALHFHLFGVTSVAQAATEIHYTLGTEGLFYVLTFIGCLVIFPIVWHKGLLEGVHWHGSAAVRRSRNLISAAVACFALALVNSVLMPGPVDAPIDKIFRMPGAAWMLFAFGVTLAPFFEELGFRGFLLPALCTSFDWMREKTTGQFPRPLDEDGHPQWSMPAMVTASILTSILFAGIHAEQTGNSLGPFLLLVCVSLVLCWARLSTRSLAASVLVHASYNFLLFSLMLIGTGGFRHLDRM